MASRLCAVLATAAFGLAIGMAPAAAEPDAAATHIQPTEYSAQTRTTYRRARPVVTVRPGRLLYRRCAAWLAVEHRLSGTVIVPRERCWWVRG